MPLSAPFSQTQRPLAFLGTRWADAPETGASHGHQRLNHGNPKREVVRYATRSGLGVAKKGPNFSR